ncbi:MAG: sulfurtransferase [Quadrisphaera sp.]
MTTDTTSTTAAISAVGFFAARLAHQTDPADLAHARATGAAPLVVDVRSAAGWAQGRIPRRRAHPPRRAHRAHRRARPRPRRRRRRLLLGTRLQRQHPRGPRPGARGLRPREGARGGYEYWVREGFAVASDAGRSRQEPDPLTAPAG